MICKPCSLSLPGEARMNGSSCRAAVIHTAGLCAVFGALYGCGGRAVGMPLWGPPL